MILRIGSIRADKQVNRIIKILINLYHQTFLKHYQNLIPDKYNELNKWMPVIAAARLDETIDSERDALIRMLREGLME
jgi:hypothetical protein